MLIHRRKMYWWFQNAATKEDSMGGHVVSWMRNEMHWPEDVIQEYEKIFEDNFGDSVADLRTTQLEVCSFSFSFSFSFLVFEWKPSPESLSYSIFLVSFFHFENHAEFGQRWYPTDTSQKDCFLDAAASLIERSENRCVKS